MTREFATSVRSFANVALSRQRSGLGAAATLYVADPPLLVRTMDIWPIASRLYASGVLPMLLRQAGRVGFATPMSGTSKAT